MPRQRLLILFTVLVTFALCSVRGRATACTAVDVVAADRSVIAGRTMEWAYEMSWTLMSFPSGTAITLTAPPSLKLPAQTVKTRYSVVGVAAGVIPGNPLLEGQNSAGLGMSANFLPGFTQYQAVTPQDKRYVSILGFGLWALGNHATVAEVRASLPTIKVWTDPSLPTGPTPPTLHLVFTDRTGAALVVEYTKGGLKMYDGVARVLTNAPTYDWHLLNLRNYLNLTTVATMTATAGNVSVTALGQGGGLLGLPGDYMPAARFVRAAFLRHHATTPATAEQAVQLVGHILNAVDIPLGIAQSLDGGKTVADFTQFVAIKDLTNDRLMITDYNHRLTFLTYDLKPIFAQDKPSAVKLADLPYARVGGALQTLAP